MIWKCQPPRRLRKEANELICSLCSFLPFRERTMTAQTIISLEVSQVPEVPQEETQPVAVRSFSHDQSSCQGNAEDAWREKAGLHWDFICNRNMFSARKGPLRHHISPWGFILIWECYSHAAAARWNISMFILGSIFDLFCLFLVNHMLINSRAAQWSEGPFPVLAGPDLSSLTSRLMETFGILMTGIREFLKYVVWWMLFIYY